MLCLACTNQLITEISAFCYQCKAPVPIDHTTGNKTLDLFIQESWVNIHSEDDSYLQWIEYSTLTDIQEMTQLRHGCTHIANWSEHIMGEPMKVTLKKIVDEWDTQSFDFYQVNSHVNNTFILSGHCAF